LEGLHLAAARLAPRGPDVQHDRPLAREHQLPGAFEQRQAHRGKLVADAAVRVVRGDTGGKHEHGERGDGQPHQAFAAAARDAHSTTEPISSTTPSRPTSTGPTVPRRSPGIAVADPVFDTRASSITW